MESAQAFWGLLLPQAIEGGALSHTDNDEDDEDERMTTTTTAAGGGGPGWTNQHTQLWFDFLNEKGGKGISRDTWNMVNIPFTLCLFSLFC